MSFHLWLRESDSLTERRRGCTQRLELLTCSAEQLRKGHGCRAQFVRQPMNSGSGSCPFGARWRPSTANIFLNSHSLQRSSSCHVRAAQCCLHAPCRLSGQNPVKRRLTWQSSGPLGPAKKERERERERVRRVHFAFLGSFGLSCLLCHGAGPGCWGALGQRLAREVVCQPEPFQSCHAHSKTSKAICRGQREALIRKLLPRAWSAEGQTGTSVCFLHLLAA